MKARGALSSVELDDVPLSEKAEAVDPDSVLPLEFDGENPVFPAIEPSSEDAFLRTESRSGKS